MGYTLGVYGISGKMGKKVQEGAEKDPFFTAVIGYNRSSTVELHTFVASCDVIIDFSTPEALSPLLTAIIESKKPLVTGTTGLSSQTRAQLEHTSSQVPILYAANFSLGIAACLQAVTLLSKMLPPNFHIAITETHHIHKKDSPSGTALAFAQATTIHPPITSIRQDEVVGKHQIFFSSPDETIELAHQAFSRETFAQGALFAAKALVLKPPGLYCLKDVLSNP